MNSKVPLGIAIFVVALLLVGEVEETRAVTCNPVELSPCASAISSSKKPSPMCCAKVKEQRPCLCRYLRDPKLQKYLRSPGAKRVAKSCGIPVPRC